MSHELAVKIAGKYPRLFGDESVLDRCDVEPGWYDIVDRLFATIEQELDLAGEAGSRFYIAQVKEKFADLRVYAWGIDQDSDLAKRISGLIRQAKQEAQETCQWCARPATQPWERGWCRTLCPACEQRAKEGKGRMGENEGV